jgi:hypothetical protein
LQGEEINADRRPPSYPMGVAPLPESRRVGKIVCGTVAAWAIRAFTPVFDGPSGRLRSSGIVGSGVEQVAYPCRETVLCDRLLDHRNAGIEPTLVDDGVSRIARRE